MQTIKEILEETEAGSILDKKVDGLILLTFKRGESMEQIMYQVYTAEILYDAAAYMIEVLRA